MAARANLCLAPGQKPRSVALSVKSHVDHHQMDEVTKNYRKADDPAFIVYTSGTTGHPKGALVAHGRHLAAAFNLVQHYPLLAERQRTVVFLPLCHVLGRDVALTLPLVSGLVPHFGEDGEDLAAGAPHARCLRQSPRMPSTRAATSACRETCSGRRTTSAS